MSSVSREGRLGSWSEGGPLGRMQRWHLARAPWGAWGQGPDQGGLRAQDWPPLGHVDATPHGARRPWAHSMAGGGVDR